MILNFAFYLTIAVLLTGIISLVDWLFIKKRRLPKTKASFLFEYSKAFFPVLLIVWIVRSFIIQSYRVPTGSLEPTVMPGNFITVEQFAYKLGFPVINKKILPIGEPKRGQIVLFLWPENLTIVFVKRVFLLSLLLDCLVIISFIKTRNFILMARKKAKIPLYCE